MEEKKNNEITVATEENKMTIYEYEEKYVKRQNARGASLIIKLAAALIGIFFIWCLFSITMKVWDINKYAGYGMAGLSVILFIVLYIVPVVKILKSDYFITNVNSKTAAAAKKHNRQLRHKIAEKIIDFNAQVSNAGWYDGRVVDELEVALHRGDEQAIKDNLNMLYSGSIKKAGKDTIFKCAMKSAMYSAVSQNNRMDAALVAVVNLQMIKDIVFLYGFRPSDARLVKIFGRVISNSLLAYGLGGVQIGNGIVRTMGDAARGIPFLGSAIAAIVDSSVQGLTNGTMTAVIGFQTIKYLNTEYKLQNILDNVELAQTEEELAATCSEIETELRRGKKAAKPA